MPKIVNPWNEWHPLRHVVVRRNTVLLDDKTMLGEEQEKAQQELFYQVGLGDPRCILGRGALFLGAVCTAPPQTCLGKEPSRATSSSRFQASGTGWEMTGCRRLERTT